MNSKDTTDTENKPITMTDEQLALIILTVASDGYCKGFDHAMELESTQGFFEYLKNLDINKYIK